MWPGDEEHPWNAFTGGNFWALGHVQIMLLCYTLMDHRRIMTDCWLEVLEVLRAQKYDCMAIIKRDCYMVSIMRMPQVAGNAANNFNGNDRRNEAPRNAGCIGPCFATWVCLQHS